MDNNDSIVARTHRVYTGEQLRPFYVQHADFPCSVYIDNARAQLTVVEDYKHCWTRGWSSQPAALGYPTLEIALAHWSVAYVADKLESGRFDASVYDATATARAFFVHILQERRAGRLSREDARDVWDDLDAFIDFSEGPDLVADHIYDRTRFYRACDMYPTQLFVFTPAPQTVRLRKIYLPALREFLRGEAGL